VYQILVGKVYQILVGKEQKCKELGEKEVWYKGTEIKV
jgi:hypothetical protein